MFLCNKYFLFANVRKIIELAKFLNANGTDTVSPKIAKRLNFLKGNSKVH